MALQWLSLCRPDAETLLTRAADFMTRLQTQASDFRDLGTTLDRYGATVGLAVAKQILSRMLSETGVDRQLSLMFSVGADQGAEDHLYLTSEVFSALCLGPMAKPTHPMPRIARRVVDTKKR